MTKQPNDTLTPGCLPPNHFAILFEGAWVFTPDSESGILATCPLADDGMHAFELGIWENGALNPLPPFKICFPMNGSFDITIDPDQIKGEKHSFSSVFNKAAAKYPFVYLASSHPDGKPKEQFVLRPGLAASSRTVSIPFPTSVRAAGALTSAVVQGPGAQHLHGGPVSVARNFVTFLFLYEFEEELDAEVELEGSGTCGEIHADEDDHPHLIFRVRPANMQTKVDDCAMLGGMQAMPTPGDDSGEKLHVTTVFDQLRQSLTTIKQSEKLANATCCDILVYHDPGAMTFDPGDTGLTWGELGLEEPPLCPEPKGRTLPACAGGGLVGSGG